MKTPQLTHPLLTALLLGAPTLQAQEGPLTDDDLGDPDITVETQTTATEDGVTTETDTQVEMPVDPVEEQSELAEPGDSADQPDEVVTTSAAATATTGDDPATETNEVVESVESDVDASNEVVESEAEAVVVDEEGEAGAAVASTETTNAVTPSGSITEILSPESQFSTLVALIQAAELEPALGEALPVTVFAPTNAAFEAYGEDRLNNLMLDDNQEQLREILLYHIISGSFTQSELEEGNLTTLQGDNLELMNIDAVAKVNGKTIVESDLEASDGVVHAIDGVLLPLAVRDPEAAVERLADDTSETQSAIDAEGPEEATVTTAAEVETTTDGEGNSATEVETATSVETDGGEPDVEIEGNEAPAAPLETLEPTVED